MIQQELEQPPLPSLTENIPMLTAEEERELARNIREGNRAAFDRFVLSNQRLVASIVNRYRGAGVPLEDLIQEGNKGLLKAIERFDETKGFKFSTFASFWIRSFVARAVMSQRSLLSIPFHIQEKYQRAMRVQQAQCGSMEDVARACEMEESDLIEMLEVMQAQSVASLDKPIVGMEDLVLGEIIMDESTEPGHMLEESYPELQQALLTHLTEKERRVILLYYGFDGVEDRSMRKVAQLLGVSRERCRQLNARALQKLKQILGPEYAL